MRMERGIPVASPGPARGFVCFRRSSAWFGLGPLLLGLMFGGCPSPHPTIQVTNQTTESGGSLQITGLGFNLGDPITITIQNIPGSTTAWSSAAGKSTDTGVKSPAGSINVTVSYSIDPSSILPGCRSGNSQGYFATLSVTAKATEDDGSSYSAGPAQVQVLNCGWIQPQVTSHQ